MTAVEVAGCTPAILRAWRNQNGLLPEARVADGWTKFSISDIAAIRCVQVLTDLSLGAQMAVDAAMKLLPVFERLFSGKDIWLQEFPLVALIDATREEPKAEVVLVHRGEPISASLWRVAYGRCIAVDLAEIVDHVRTAILDFRPDIEPVRLAPEVEALLAKLQKRKRGS